MGVSLISLNQTIRSLLNVQGSVIVEECCNVNTLCNFLKLYWLYEEGCSRIYLIDTNALRIIGRPYKLSKQVVRLEFINSINVQCDYQEGSLEVGSHSFSIDAFLPINEVGITQYESFAYGLIGKLVLYEGLIKTLRSIELTSSLFCGVKTNHISNGLQRNTYSIKQELKMLEEKVLLTSENYPQCFRRVYD